MMEAERFRTMTKLMMLPRTGTGAKHGKGSGYKDQQGEGDPKPANGTFGQGGIRPEDPGEDLDQNRNHQRENDESGAPINGEI